MRIQITRLNDDVIGTSVDLRDVKSRGELSHVLAELELIKQKILLFFTI